MDKTHNNNSGFRFIPVMVAVLVVGALLFAGYTVFNKNNSKKNALTNITESQPTNSEANTSKQEPAGQTYLVIKEWGVKLPLSSEISDAYYVVSSSSEDKNGEPNTMWVSLKSLNATGCNAANANKGVDGQIGGIIKALPGDKDFVTGKTYQELYPYGTTIDGNYYTYLDWGRKVPCASPEKLQSISTAFATATKNISIN